MQQCKTSYVLNTLLHIPPFRVKCCHAALFQSSLLKKHSTKLDAGTQETQWQCAPHRHSKSLLLPASQFNSSSPIQFMDFSTARALHIYSMQNMYSRDYQAQKMRCCLPWPGSNSTVLPIFQAPVRI